MPTAMDVASAHQTFAAEKLRLCFIWVGQKPCDHLEVAVTALLASLAPLNAPRALLPWAPAPPVFLFSSVVLLGFANVCYMLMAA